MPFHHLKKEQVPNTALLHKNLQNSFYKRIFVSVYHLTQSDRHEKYHTRNAKEDGLSRPDATKTYRKETPDYAAHRTETPPENPQKDRSRIHLL